MPAPTVKRFPLRHIASRVPKRSADDSAQCFQGVDWFAESPSVAGHANRTCMSRPVLKCRFPAVLFRGESLGRLQRWTFPDLDNERCTLLQPPARQECQLV